MNESLWKVVFPPVTSKEGRRTVYVYAVTMLDAVTRATNSLPHPEYLQSVKCRKLDRKERILA